MADDQDGEVEGTDHGDETVDSNPTATPEQKADAEVDAVREESDAVAAAEGAPDDASAAEPSPEPTDDAAHHEPEPAPEPELLHGAPVTWSRGQVVLHPSREHYVQLVGDLRAQGFWTCVDLCGVDYLGHGAARDLPPGTAPERFEVVVMLVNHTTRERVRLRVQVPEHDPSVPTLFGLHPGVENPEREVYDMFGIDFVGHPDLSRILMPDTWQGHPLRKDFAVGRIPVQFKGVTSAR